MSELLGQKYASHNQNSKLSIPSCQKRSEKTVTGQTKRAFVASRKMSDHKDQNDNSMLQDEVEKQGSGDEVGSRM